MLINSMLRTTDQHSGVEIPQGDSWTWESLRNALLPTKGWNGQGYHWVSKESEKWKIQNKYRGKDRKKYRQKDRMFEVTDRKNKESCNIKPTKTIDANRGKQTNNRYVILTNVLNLVRAFYPAGTKRCGRTAPDGSTTLELSSLWSSGLVVGYLTLPYPEDWE